jgi:hypothetical protein
MEFNFLSKLFLKIDIKDINFLNLFRALYQGLKSQYREMHNRMITYEKEHEASSGNIVKWVFKAFDKYGFNSC